MPDPPRMNAAQLRHAGRLIRRQCANFDNGKCLLLGDVDPCPQLITFSLICRYFRRAVLPEDAELCAKIFREHPARRCVLCGARIYSTSNAAKYCPSCAIKERRRRDVLRKKKRT